ncbi:MAG TPA: carboxypeptidase regulatory-like domain-containing protein, partial [Gemmatimonadaceae bacterium]
MNHIARAALGVALLLIAAPLGAQQESTTPAPQVGPPSDTTAVHSDRPLVDSSRTADAPRKTRATAAVGGTVRDSVAGTAVAGARVELLGTRYYAYVRPDGTFSMGNVPHGVYTVRVLRMGYEPLSIKSFRIPEDAAGGRLDLFMHRAMLALSEVVVTPGYFGLLKPSLATPQALSKEQLQTIPQVGEDIYRAVARLPGVSADDFSAKFNVRGGSGDELYVTLDGLELVEPFHLRDVGGAFSIVDIQSLGTASLTTGGFSSEYGDRLTGVFSMQTSDPQTDRMRTSLGLSVMNARLTSQGGFAGGKGGWLVSMRPGYLDVALKLTSVRDSIRPRYYDLFAKAQYDLGAGGRVAMHVLRASDTFRYLQTDDPNVASDYASNYAWLTWDDAFGSRLKESTVLSTGLQNWRRDGDQTRNGLPSAFITDHRT